ncbi:hypothetical protein C900_00048 [Fulvivirga imtechensis AK7]|uniref:HutD-family protein n=1 Tax=Fulvivirga imtechensis AK7 TaxID=1237149 RepID=L8K1S3_9BACT|nr:HutD family protein [Fulvivirga imtechensis]ELR73884.1 hypothetical protein C900_00048 [Fulvivirga imtechensis AK7]
MQINIIRKKEQATTRWTGGTTTELVIYPKKSRFKDRNFFYRLSLAEVEIDESSFTKLPGIDRTLLVLDGRLTLEHPGKHTVTLEKFDTDTFNGGWDTISYGRATDFNLMTRGKTKGRLEGFTLKKGDTYKHAVNKDSSVIGCYTFRGALEIALDSHYSLGEGDLMLISVDQNIKDIVLKAQEDSDVVISALTINE